MILENNNKINKLTPATAPTTAPAIVPEERPLALAPLSPSLALPPLPP